MSEVYNDEPLDALTQITFTLVGADYSGVDIQAIEYIVEDSRSAPPAGTLVYNYGEGVSPIVDLRYDLDERDPMARTNDEASEYYFENYHVSLAYNESVRFSATIYTSDCLCEFHFVALLSDGSYVHIDNSGKPWIVSAFATSYQVAYSRSTEDGGIPRPCDWGDELLSTGARVEVQGRTTRTGLVVALTVFAAMVGACGNAGERGGDATRSAEPPIRILNSDVSSTVTRSVTSSIASSSESAGVKTIASDSVTGDRGVPTSATGYSVEPSSPLPIEERFVTALASFDPSVLDMAEPGTMVFVYAEGLIELRRSGAIDNLPAPTELAPGSWAVGDVVLSDFVLSSIGRIQGLARNGINVDDAISAGDGTRYVTTPDEQDGEDWSGEVVVRIHSVQRFDGFVRVLVTTSNSSSTSSQVVLNQYVVDDYVGNVSTILNVQLPPGVTSTTAFIFPQGPQIDPQEGGEARGLVAIGDRVNRTLVVALPLT